MWSLYARHVDDFRSPPIRRWDAASHESRKSGTDTTLGGLGRCGSLGLVSGLPHRLGCFRLRPEPRAGPASSATVDWTQVDGERPANLTATDQVVTSSRAAHSRVVRSGDLPAPSAPPVRRRLPPAHFGTCPPEAPRSGCRSTAARVSRTAASHSVNCVSWVSRSARR